jgi:hypothetical protein
MRFTFPDPARPEYSQPVALNGASEIDLVASCKGETSSLWTISLQLSRNLQEWVETGSWSSAVGRHQVPRKRCAGFSWARVRVERRSFGPAAEEIEGFLHDGQKESRT